MQVAGKKNRSTVDNRIVSVIMEKPRLETKTCMYMQNQKSVLTNCDSLIETENLGYSKKDM